MTLPTNTLPQFATDPHDIYYNKLIKVWSNASRAKGGRCLPVDYGPSIGQGFVLCNIDRQTEPHLRKIATMSADALEDQFARPDLWRAHGYWSSMEGVSGSPLEVGNADDQPRIFGFANFEWRAGKVAIMWGEDDADVAQLPLVSRLSLVPRFFVYAVP